MKFGMTSDVGHQYINKKKNIKTGGKRRTQRFREIESERDRKNVWQRKWLGGGTTKKNHITLK